MQSFNTAKYVKKSEGKVMMKLFRCDGRLVLQQRENVAYDIYPVNVMCIPRVLYRQPKVLGFLIPIEKIIQTVDAQADLSLLWALIV